MGLAGGIARGLRLGLAGRGRSLAAYLASIGALLWGSASGDDYLVNGDDEIIK